VVRGPGWRKAHAVEDRLQRVRLPLPGCASPSTTDKPPRFAEKGPFSGRAEIETALCKGCGPCVASRRSGAGRLAGFTDARRIARIAAALTG